jgi:hypothetical protein
LVWPALPGLRRDRRDVDDATPARRHHLEQQRLRDVEEAVERHVDHARPLLEAHAGERRVVVHAGVVDQDLHRPRFEHFHRGFAHRGAVGHVERDGLGAPALGADASASERASASRVRACTTTWQPSRARRRQIAAPRPPLPPVTSARLTARRCA